MAEQTENRKGKRRIKTKLSRIQFPEVCPVCLDNAEDLVFVNVIERIGPESYESSSMIKGDDKTSAALEAAKGATTFPVPTCLIHSSKSVRSLRTKLYAAIGFFIFFYPILFFLLQINTVRSIQDRSLSLLLASSSSPLYSFYRWYTVSSRGLLNVRCDSRT
jgi:hypothetical protein